MHSVTLIPGDGVGPEVIQAARRVVEATGVSIHWEAHEAGERAVKSQGVPILEPILESIRKNKVALKGPVSTPVGTGFRSVNVAIRRALDLYVNFRPAKALPGVKTAHPQLDLIVFRENTEDLYVGIEFEQKSSSMNLLRQFMSQHYQIDIAEDAACSFKLITWEGSMRIIRYAFDYAVTHRRRKVTAVHNATILKATDGLFLEAAYTVAKEFPEIEFNAQHVNNLCTHLARNPEVYDILVLPNLYGDIVSDLCAGLVGGVGLAPSANLGEQAAVFEPVHGSAPKYAGQNKANPIAAILSAVLMLRYLDEEAAAQAIETAVGEAVKASAGEPFVGTQEMADRIIERLGAASPRPLRTKSIGMN